MDKKAITLDQLTPGEVLGQDIYDEDNKLLLKKGTVLLSVILDAFRKREMTEVFIYAESAVAADSSASAPASAAAAPYASAIDAAMGAFMSEGDAEESASPAKTEGEAPARPAAVPEDTQALIHLGTFYTKILYEMRRAMLRGQYNKVLQDEIPDAVGRMVSLLVSMEDEQIVRFFVQAKSLHPESSFEVHAANVCLLSSMLGYWLEINDYEIRELAIGAVLHDIGETQIPGSILNKKGRLTESEWSIVKTHPLLSAKIMNKNKWASPRMLTSVLRHHERLDSTGYPYGIPGSEIPLGARIIAAAGSFDAMTSVRPYKPAMSLFGAMGDLKDRSFGQLDARITRTLYEKFLRFYLGRKVELTNGDQGTITLVQGRENDEHLLIKSSQGYYQMMAQNAPAIRWVLEADNAF